MAIRPTKRAIKPPAARPILQPTGESPIQVRVQQAIVNATKESRSDPHSRGRAIRVYFSGNATAPTFPHTLMVSHGLGRKPEGAYVRKNSKAHSSGAISVGAMTTRMVTVTALLSCTVELWVY